MKASQFLISTLKEAPADAEVASHQLMMRAGKLKATSSCPKTCTKSRPSFATSAARALA